MFALARIAGSRGLAAAACPRALAVARAAAPALQQRAFSGSGATKVLKTVQAEIKHEDEQYEQAKEIQAFLKKSDFKFTDKEGDVNLMLEREAGGKKVTIEWQLTSPFDPEMDNEGEESFSNEATDFIVTVTKTSDGSGLSFYCSTQTGEDHRYVIGNVKAFKTGEERESMSSYNGPEFEDVDDKLQEALDEYLAEVGMGTEVCDFIDATATDKEQREYIRWLKVVKDFMES